MRAMELKHEGKSRSITRNVRIEETVLVKVSSNEREASSDARKEGALAHSSSACEMDATERTRQHRLIIAQIRQVGRIRLRAQQGVAGAAQQSAQSAPLLLFQRTWPPPSLP